ncbi:GNAT family N-acetyltransferase [Kitasatospora sp. NPDC059795]|uniref:GNAT family N-acetyltransferase n=1 Tax=Kitasatospora sp. NPDC059795 TaxID=3346949 RepID=UPI003647DF87
MSYPVRLTGARTVLREFRPDDAADAHRVMGDDRVTKWLSFDSRSSDQVQTMVDGAVDRAQHTPRAEFYLAVTTPDSDQLVGFVRIGIAGVQAGKLGYAIAADSWGQGLASDAARTVVQFAFDELGLHRISAAIGPDNAASIKLVENLGFIREGVLRDHVFTNGSWRDSVLYSVLAHEWTSTSSR